MTGTPIVIVNLKETGIPLDEDDLLVEVELGLRDGTRLTDNYEIVDVSLQADVQTEGRGGAKER